MQSLIFKKYADTFRLLVILLLFGAMVGSVVFFGFFNNKHESVGGVVQDTPCVPVVSTVTSRTVVLRVDDIQAFAWGTTSRKMIADASVRNIPLTLGIIPFGLHEDTELFSFLTTNACSVEFALHGLTHYGGADGLHPEFGTSTKEEAYVPIEQGLQILKKITTDSIVTWIPPLNVQSEGTIEALDQLGFTHLSSEGKGALDYDAATFSYETDSLLSPEIVTSSCLRAFEKSTHCIVMLHPQDFADGLVHNEEKYKRYYLDLLDALIGEGVTFSRLKDIPL
jgi:hypothetical protein